MQILEMMIKTISWVTYAIAANSTVADRKKLFFFMKDVFVFCLPEKVYSMLTKNHYTLSYLNYVIRKNKIDNNYNEEDNVYGIIKEAVQENQDCSIKNEDVFISNSKCIEQIDRASESGYVLGVFIQSVLNILNIMSYNDYESGKKGWKNVHDGIIILQC